MWRSFINVFISRFQLRMGYLVESNISIWIAHTIRTNSEFHHHAKHMHAASRYIRVCSGTFNLCEIVAKFRFELSQTETRGYECSSVLKWVSGKGRRSKQASQQEDERKQLRRSQSSRDLNRIIITDTVCVWHTHSHRHQIKKIVNSWNCMQNSTLHSAHEILLWTLYRMSTKNSS